MEKVRFRPNMDYVYYARLVCAKCKKNVPLCPIGFKSTCCNADVRLRKNNE